MFKINTKDLELLEKPIKSVYYKYLIPAVLSMMSFALIVFFDTMIIGQGIGLVTIFIQIIPRILGENGLWLVVPAAEFITLVFSIIMIIILLRKSNCESNNNKITY